MQISVYQHIYSNVPKERSPKNRRGYQTLFYTHDSLTSEDIFILEDRAQYYAGETEPIKYQFHMLQDGKAVVSQIVPLAELDEFGRKGRYLSHSLIIPSSAFQKLEYCPLSLFSPKVFVTNLDNAFNYGNSQTGNISETQVNVSDNWQDVAIKFARQWHNQDLESLIRLGWQAEKLGQERSSVIWQGTTHSMLQAMSVIFLLTAPEKRPFLTFDTHALGCDWTRDWPFWVWGGLEKKKGATEHLADVDKRQINSNLSPQNDSPFEKWVLQHAIPDKLENYLAYQEDALSLNTLLEGKNVNLTKVDEKFGQRFAFLNADYVANQVLSYFPANMSQEVKKTLFSEIHNDPWGYLQKLETGFSQNEVAEIIYGLQLRRLEKPLADEDRKIFEQFAHNVQHEELASVVKLCNGDIASWQSSLSNLSSSAYYEIVKQAVKNKVVLVSDAFCPDHFVNWSEIANQYLKPGELKSILKQLKKSKDPFDVDQFIRLLPHLAESDRQTLANWLQSYKGSAPNLRLELDLPEPTSVLSKLRGIFSSNSDKSKREEK